MSELDKIYPFEPLPPPEHPAMKKLREQNPEEGRVDKTNRQEQSKSKRNREIAFDKILSGKLESRSSGLLPDGERKKLCEAAKNMEAFFIYTILKNFNKTLTNGGLFPKEAGASLYMDMFLEGVADEVSKSPNGLGLAEQIVKSVELSLAQKGLLENQEE